MERVVVDVFASPLDVDDPARRAASRSTPPPAPWPPGPSSTPVPTSCPGREVDDGAPLAAPQALTRRANRSVIRNQMGVVEFLVLAPTPHLTRLVCARAGSSR